MISRDLMLIIAIPREVPTSNIGPRFRISVVTGNKKINIFLFSPNYLVAWLAVCHGKEHKVRAYKRVRDW